MLELIYYSVIVAFNVLFSSDFLPLFLLVLIISAVGILLQIVRSL